MPLVAKKILNQPIIAQWNLTRFAEAILPLLSSNRQVSIDKATDVLQKFPKVFEIKWLTMMRLKLGLSSVQPDDENLIKNPF